MLRRVVTDATGVGAVYLHVPFCARKCAYCDFASWATWAGDPAMEAYVEALASQVAEMRALGLLDSCRTGYVGGGTPSHLGARSLSRLLEALPPLEELTCEANPDSLSDDVLAAMLRGGVSRVSVGVQSLVDAELMELGRLHDAQVARERVAAAVATGLDVSVDLMCAIPRQTDETWERTLYDALRLGVGHVSVYPLAIEEGTPLEARYANASTPWNDEDVQARRMERAQTLLGEAGFARYEVASHALPGKACRHNLAYWTGVTYLGLGVGASGMLDRPRYERLRRACPQLPDVGERIVRVRLRVASDRDELAHDARLSALRFDLELLNERQALAEDLMLGMRLTSGVDASLMDPFADLRDDLVARGLVWVREGRMAPTHNGWLLGNELYGALWDLADGPVEETSC